MNKNETQSLDNNDSFVNAMCYICHAYAVSYNHPPLNSLFMLKCPETPLFTAFRFFATLNDTIIYSTWPVHFNEAALYSIYHSRDLGQNHILRVV